MPSLFVSITISSHLKAGVVEKAPSEVVGKEFYPPHRAVVRENAETTKTRIVYDASARERENTPSLNDCLLIRARLCRTSCGVCLYEIVFIQSPWQAIYRRHSFKFECVKPNETCCVFIGSKISTPPRSKCFGLPELYSVWHRPRFC